MKRISLLASMLSLTALALLACVPLLPAPENSLPVTPAAPGIAQLAGAGWILTHYGPSTAPLSALPGTAPTLTIAQDGQVSGKAGCNSYFGSLTVNGSEVAFGQMGRTLMACDDARMALEETYLAALQAAESFTLENGRLIIGYQDGGSALVFERAPISSYLGPDWILESFVGGDAVSSVLAGVEITLTFEPGSSTVTGSAGCNRYTASVDAAVDANEGRFAVGAIGTTKMSCAPQIMDQEDAFLRALQAARSHAFQDGRLILSADGQQLLIFAAPR